MPEAIRYKESRAKPGDSHPSQAGFAVTNLLNADILINMCFAFLYTYL